MKKITALLFFCLISGGTFAQLSDGDREFAIKYLKASQHFILETISELDEADYNIQPVDGGWSVSNSLEHILITETAFHEMVQAGTAQAKPDPDFDNSFADGVLIGNFNNRGNSVTTSPNFEPSGQWSTKEEMIAALSESRNKLIEYLKSTDNNLRQYAMPMPFGNVDAYQIYLIISAHSQRHTNQMVEVLAELNAE